MPSSAEQPSEQERGDLATAGEPTRQTSRQRRIEEQRHKIDALRQQQRRKRLLQGLAAATVALAAIVTVLLLVRPPASAQGRQVAVDSSRDHVPTGSPVSYSSRPPSSGRHYAELPRYGVFDAGIEPGYWIHNLEHGGIVILYRKDLCDAGCQSQVRDIYAAAPRSNKYGTVKLLITPYQDMDRAIAIAAWGWIDELDEFDRERLLAFYRAHLDRGPEDAP